MRKLRLLLRMPYKKIYIIELLLKDDVITHFLNVNNIKTSDSLEKLLKTYSVNREVILKKLSNGDLKMSKFILSS
mgnify:CR=1 FL=1